MNFHLVSIVLLIGVHSLSSCKTAGGSKFKDIGGSPADVSKASYVVFLGPEYHQHKGIEHGVIVSFPYDKDTEPMFVHWARCPSAKSPINRSCQGLEHIEALSTTEYDAGLRKAILRLRPGGASVTTYNPDLEKALEDKITRINNKLSDRGLSDSEKQALRPQLADLNAQLLDAKSLSLNSDEQKRYDVIMQKLNSGDDVTFDEGELNYELALAPFDSERNCGGCAGSSVISGP